MRIALPFESAAHLLPPVGVRQRVFLALEAFRGLFKRSHDAKPLSIEDREVELLHPARLDALACNLLVV